MSSRGPRAGGLSSSVVAEFGFADVGAPKQDRARLVNGVRRYQHTTGRTAQGRRGAQLPPAQPQLPCFSAASGHLDVVTCPTALAVAKRAIVDRRGDLGRPSPFSIVM